MRWISRRRLRRLSRNAHRRWSRIARPGRFVLIRNPGDHYSWVRGRTPSPAAAGEEIGSEGRTSERTTIQPDSISVRLTGFPDLTWELVLLRGSVYSGLQHRRLPAIGGDRGQRIGKPLSRRRRFRCRDQAFRGWPSVNGRKRAAPAVQAPGATAAGSAPEIARLMGVQPGDCGRLSLGGKRRRRRSDGQQAVSGKVDSALPMFAAWP